MTPEEYIEYVRVQEQYNHRHSDGSLRGRVEEAELDADKLAKYIKDNDLPSGSFLDVGCRVGYGAQRLEKHFPLAKVHGVDVVELFVNYAQEVGVDARVADMHDFSDIPGKWYAWSFCIGTLEHAYDIKKALSEILRVSSVGSYLSVPIESQAVFDANPSHHFHGDSTETWDKLFDEMAGDEWEYKREVFEDHYDIILRRK
jgi:ubiquinone/menaquinone biosynthesis C-methylase UbiE